MSNAQRPTLNVESQRSFFVGRWMLDAERSPFSNLGAYFHHAERQQLETHGKRARLDTNRLNRIRQR